MGIVLSICRIGSYNHMQNGNGTCCLQDWFLKPHAEPERYLVFAGLVVITAPRMGMVLGVCRIGSDNHMQDGNSTCCL